MRNANGTKEGIRAYVWWFAIVAALIIGGLQLLHGLNDLSPSAVVAVVAAALLIGIYTLPVRTE